MTHRYTIDGSAELEAAIREIAAVACDCALEAAGEDRLHALMLCGAYGRGEGPVRTEDGGEKPCGPLEILPVARDSRQAHRILPRLKDAGEEATRQTGVDVLFHQPVSAADIPYIRNCIWLAELNAGHVVLYGPPDALQDLSNPCVSAIPFQDFTWLLLTRQAEIVALKARLREEDVSDAGQREIVRAIQAAYLALGDCVMHWRGCWSPLLAVRQRRWDSALLWKVPGGDLLERRFRETIAFHLHPVHQASDGLTLPEWLEECIRLCGQIHLWYEGKRLQQQFADWEQYAALPCRLPGAGLRGTAINLVRNLRTEPLGYFASVSLHPHDRLLAGLGAVLHSQPSASEEQAFLRIWRDCGPHGLEFG